jgi:signal transduction protein with GAF and PtsI domain
MPENQKLLDRLTEQLQRKITRVTEAICRLREETRHKIQSIRDSLNKASTRVHERVSRHIKSTKEQHDDLSKEMNTGLNMAKQERSKFMQDVNKNNQEVRDGFCRSELANARKIAELDREVAELREQISGVANNTSIQPNNFTLSDVNQAQPGQSGNNAVSEPCASNSSCMIESIEIGCSDGMNRNALSGNVCSMTSTTSGGQILPELSFLTFRIREQSSVHFLTHWGPGI